jgi:hypothetical protein
MAQMSRSDLEWLIHAIVNNSIVGLVSKASATIAADAAIAALSGERATPEPWTEFYRQCGMREGVVCMHQNCPRKGMTCASWNKSPNLCPRRHYGKRWDAGKQEWRNT